MLDLITSYNKHSRNGNYFFIKSYFFGVKANNENWASYIIFIFMFYKNTK